MHSGFFYTDAEEVERAPEMRPEAWRHEAFFKNRAGQLGVGLGVLDAFG